MVPEEQKELWEYIRLLEERIKFLEEITKHLQPL